MAKFVREDEKLEEMFYFARGRMKPRGVFSLCSIRVTRDNIEKIEAKAGDEELIDKVLKGNFFTRVEKFLGTPTDFK